MSMEKLFHMICSVFVLVMLGCTAYYGLAGPLSMPVPDIISNFAVFYTIFAVFDWSTVIFTLPIVLAAIYAGVYFASKGFKVIFLCFEVVFVVLIVLCGFGIIA